MTNENSREARGIESVDYIPSQGLCSMVYLYGEELGKNMIGQLVRGGLEWKYMDGPLWMDRNVRVFSLHVTVHQRMT